MESLYEDLMECMLDGDDERAIELTKEAMDNGVEPLAIIQEYMVPILNDIGDQFARLELFLPDLVMASDVAAGMKDTVSEKLVRAEGDSAGKVVIGTVQGDVHDIGKNIVSTLLEVNGYEVYDLGNDVKPFDFISKAKEVNADVIGLSSLLTTSMPYMEDVLKTLNGLGIRDNFKVVVGGGPVSAEWAASIGADGYSEDANAAIELIGRMVQEKKGA